MWREYSTASFTAFSFTSSPPDDPPDDDEGDADAANG